MNIEAVASLAELTRTYTPLELRKLSGVSDHRTVSGSSILAETIGNRSLRNQMILNSLLTARGLKLWLMSLDGIRQSIQEYKALGHMELHFVGNRHPQLFLGQVSSALQGGTITELKATADDELAEDIRRAEEYLDWFDRRLQARKSIQASRYDAYDHYMHLIDELFPGTADVLGI